jgi:hypothetical protein
MIRWETSAKKIHALRLNLPHEVLEIHVTSGTVSYMHHSITKLAPMYWINCYLEVPHSIAT